MDPDIWEVCKCRNEKFHKAGEQKLLTQSRFHCFRNVGALHFIHNPQLFLRPPLPRC